MNDTVNNAAARNLVVIAFNAVTAKLHKPTRDVRMLVSQSLSYLVDGAEHTPLYKEGHWDGRVSLFDYATNTFPAGFVHLVTTRLRGHGCEVRHVKKPLPPPLGPPDPKVDDFPDDPRYDFQMETVRRLERHGQIVVYAATGAGKSRIARLAHARIARPTLFLTTRGILMYQMKEAFERDGAECSVLGDGQFGHVNIAGQSCVKRMCVGMVQTLMSRLKEPGPRDTPEARTRQAALRQQTLHLLEKFEFVILEEAHEASANSYYEILRHCRNARYRLALTATPFMRDSEEANMRLMAVSGPVALRVPEKLLIERGILARPYFKFVCLRTPPPGLSRHAKWQTGYQKGIVENGERNRIIIEEVARAVRHGLTAMVLVQRIEHGKTLYRMLRGRDLTVDYIKGDDEQAERRDALARLADGRLNVLIGTTILDVGVDVPAVGLIVLAGGGKAEVALRQRIGRGLRAKKRGPNVALVVDFDDPFNTYTKSHAASRRAIIAETEGFGENIVLADFDYAALGFTPTYAAPSAARVA
jgi:superfamily II DNA or RNA helicase